MKYFVRPETGAEDRFGPKIGPFNQFLQLTYGTLRVGPNGDEIARRHEDGLWYFEHLLRTSDYKPPGSAAGYLDVRLPADYAEANRCTDVSKHGWTDIVIWAE
jgi:hypothetical protein